MKHIRINFLLVVSAAVFIASNAFADSANLLIIEGVVTAIENDLVSIKTDTGGVAKLPKTLIRNLENSSKTKDSLSTDDDTPVSDVISVGNRVIASAHPLLFTALNLPPTQDSDLSQ